LKPIITKGVENVAANDHRVASASLLQMLPPVHPFGHGALFALQQAPAGSARRDEPGRTPRQTYAGSGNGQTGEPVKNVSRFSFLVGCELKDGPIYGSVWSTSEDNPG
jgi:hypothetical protein